MRLTQVHLIEVGAQRFGINDSAKKVDTPMVEGYIASRDQCPDPKASDAQVLEMQSLVGTVAYVAANTRHTLKHSVSSLSRVATNPAQEHLKAARRALTYLYQTKNVPLVFKHADWTGLDGVHYKAATPYAYADASLGNSGRCELRRSFGGCVVVMNGAVIHSRSGLQKSTADSSAKAETIEIYYTTQIGRAHV